MKYSQNNVVYGVKTKNGVRETEDAKDAAAIFLYESQAGNDPHWTVFPGDYETRDFYSLNYCSGEFFVDEDRKVAALFDSEEAAHELEAKLAHEGKLYSVYQGGVNSDGFIAGPMNDVFPEDDYYYYFDEEGYVHMKYYYNDDDIIIS